MKVRGLFGLIFVSVGVKPLSRIESHIVRAMSKWTAIGVVKV
jgi:hypothetical protein